MGFATRHSGTMTTGGGAVQSVFNAPDVAEEYRRFNTTLAGWFPTPNNPPGDPGTVPDDGASSDGLETREQPVDEKPARSNERLALWLIGGIFVVFAWRKL